MIGKKGLSELITIVLIIGMVVALASFIILWSTNYFQRTTQETSLQAAKSLTCTRDIELVINDVCYDSKIYIDIENKRDRQINGDFLLIKVEGSQDTLLQPTPPGVNLLSFDKKQISLTYFPEIGSIKKVSIIPRIETSEGFVFCTDNVAESFAVRNGNCNV